jgi:membrane associated rhomboid family serine protease
MPEQACAFHPDRMTAVTCSRCGRPICPDDMIDAPVGVHCPICTGRAREGKVGAAQYRAQQRIEQAPIVRRFRAGSLTTGLIGVNVGVFILMVARGGGGLGGFTGETLFDFGALIAPLPTDQWWRLFTAMFVHITPMHLAFNMYALFLFGRAIEERYGKLRFMALYLTSGLLGSGASLAFTGFGLRAGASGAVFGILGGWIAFYALHRHTAAARGQLQSLFFLVGLNLFLGASIGGIDNAAHIGGLAGGIILGLGLELGCRRAAKWRVASPMAFITVLAIAIALIAANTISDPTLFQPRAIWPLAL